MTNTFSTPTAVDAADPQEKHRSAKEIASHNFSEAISAVFVFLLAIFAVIFGTRSIFRHTLWLKQEPTSAWEVPAMIMMVMTVLIMIGMGIYMLVHGIISIIRASNAYKQLDDAEMRSAAQVAVTPTDDVPA